MREGCRRRPRWHTGGGGHAWLHGRASHHCRAALLPCCSSQSCIVGVDGRSQPQVKSSWLLWRIFRPARDAKAWRLALTGESASSGALALAARNSLTPFAPLTPPPSLQVLLNIYVKPHRPVVSYLTALTGLTPDLIETQGVPLEQAITMVKGSLPTSAVLVGQNILQVG